jgi:hypothetical protein
MWICVKCKEFHEDTFDSCWKCQTFNAKSQSKKRERPKQVKEWTDAVSYTDFKKNFQTIICEGKISGAISGTIRWVIASSILSIMEPAKGIGKAFNFAGSKAIRKHGHKANPLLKGLYKPLVKYVKTGKLSDSEKKNFREVLTRKRVPRILSYGLAAPLMLIFRATLGPVGYLFYPIVAEMVTLVYKKWGVEWFLQGWNSREKNNQQLKQ